MSTRTQTSTARRTGRGARRRLRARRLSPRWRRRSCSRPSRSSTCPARTSASACTSPPTPTAASSACGRTSPFRCRATISPRPRPARRRASAISARCSAIAATRRPNSCRPASNPSAAPTRRRPTPRCWRSASTPPRITASPRRKSAWATSACSPRWSRRSIWRRPGSAGW